MKRIICREQWVDDGEYNPVWAWHHAWDKDDYCEVTDEEYAFLMQAMETQKKVQAMLADINTRRVTIPDDGVITYAVPEEFKPSALSTERFKTVFALTEQT